MVSVAKVSVTMVSRSVVVGTVVSMMTVVSVMEPVVTVVSMEPVSVVTMGIGISFSLPLSVVMAVVSVVASVEAMMAVVAMSVGQGVSVPVSVEPIVSVGISLSNSAGFSLGLGGHGGKKAKGGDCLWGRHTQKMNLSKHLRLLVLFWKLTMNFMVMGVSKLEDVAGLRILNVSGLDIPCGRDQDHGTGMRQRDQASSPRGPTTDVGHGFQMSTAEV